MLFEHPFTDIFWWELQSVVDEGHDQPELFYAVVGTRIPTSPCPDKCCQMDLNSLPAPTSGTYGSKVANKSRKRHHGQRCGHGISR